MFRALNMMTGLPVIIPCTLPWSLSSGASCEAWMYYFDYSSLNNEIGLLAWLFKSCSFASLWRYLVLRHSSSLTVHLDTLDRDTATAFGKKGQTKDGNCNRHLLVAGKSSAYNQAHALALDIKDRASIALTRGSTATTWKAGSTSFAAKRAV
jgi:hypothetical protein